MINRLANKHLQVKLVQDSPTSEPTPHIPQVTPVDPLDIVVTTAAGVGAVVGGYVILDTFRQSIIHIVQTKVR